MVQSGSVVVAETTQPTKPEYISSLTLYRISQLTSEIKVRIPFPRSLSAAKQYFLEGWFAQKPRPMQC